MPGADEGGCGESGEGSRRGRWAGTTDHSGGASWQPLLPSSVDLQLLPGFTLTAEAVTLVLTGSVDLQQTITPHHPHRAHLHVLEDAA